MCQEQEQHASYGNTVQVHEGRHAAVHANEENGAIEARGMLFSRRYECNDNRHQKPNTPANEKRHTNAGRMKWYIAPENADNGQCDPQQTKPTPHFHRH